MPINFDDENHGDLKEEARERLLPLATYLRYLILTNPARKKKWYVQLK